MATTKNFLGTAPPPLPATNNDERTPQQEDI